MDRRILYIWLSKINGVGPVIASKLIEFFGRIDFVYEAKYDDLIKYIYQNENINNKKRTLQKY